MMLVQHTGVTSRPLSQFNTKYLLLYAWIINVVLSHVYFIKSLVSNYHNFAQIEHFQ